MVFVLIIKAQPRYIYIYMPYEILVCEKKQKKKGSKKSHTQKKWFCQKGSWDGTKTPNWCDQSMRASTRMKRDTHRVLEALGFSNHIIKPKHIYIYMSASLDWAQQSEHPRRFIIPFSTTTTKNEWTKTPLSQFTLLLQ